MTEMDKEDGQYATTQLTSKRIKLVTALSWVLILLSFTVLAATEPDTGGRSFGGAVLMLSIVMWCGARLTKWWQHD